MYILSGTRTQKNLVLGGTLDLKWAAVQSNC